ncbi:CPBP family intramembrane metalloprotease [Corynebacterium afermentans subsp. lipophilum]|uniref:CPBP family intramembrane glutamic endopeptidase n=1 Tax=Corynebacterium afermentans TaxID=38286 RepID=UPI00188C1120|nr:CPBP family intramembrane glutamic endopeptidase [Corynebacterium afermentans]MBF4547759.1 CPBP family intramembrane metalloprotease [Corynebacterium afermentans subsp. lipophilum]WJY58526.1 CAAX amino terminal protease self- immunity [Corynebacterium afermentans subsp. lipophilum]
MTRQWLFLAPCALGALGLFLARRAGDGTAGFYWATAFTAVVYAAAWWLWGNRQAFMGPKKLIDVLRGALIGAALALVFVLGALVVQHFPFLAGPAAELLDTPDKGGYALTLLVLVVNGIGEELVFRDVVPRQLRGMGQSVVQAGVWSTLAYCLVTCVMGVPLLVFAAGVLGAVAYFEAAKTGRLYSPIAEHLTWSIGMLLILPQFF